MYSDPIADLLTRLRNAYAVKHHTVTLPYSAIKHQIVKVLAEQSFLQTVATEGQKTKKQLVLTLKYSRNLPAVRAIKRISKPGVRIYVKAAKLPSYLRGLGITILSTSQGLMTAKKAWQKKLGGEVICQVK